MAKFSKVFVPEEFAEFFSQLGKSRVNHEQDNVNVHRAAANIIVSKSRAARGSVCNVLLSRVLVKHWLCLKLETKFNTPA